MTFLGIHWQWWMVFAALGIIALSAAAQVHAHFRRRRWQREIDAQQAADPIGYRLREMHLMYNGAAWMPVNDRVNIGNAGNFGGQHTEGERLAMNAAAGRQTHNIPGHGALHRPSTEAGDE